MTAGARSADNSTGQPAREAALQLLKAVLDRRQPLDESLEQGLSGLEGPDRGFARAIATTVLRRLGQIDALLAHCLDRPLADNAARARNALRIGIAELMFMNVAAYAAVNSAVELCGREAGQRRLVNAVLRRLGREGAALLAAQDAARLNTPEWLWQSWSDSYGEATARAIAEAHLTRAPLDLSVKAEPGHWAERLGATLLANGSLRLAEFGQVTALPGFEEGAWWVQDAAAALPVTLFGNVRDQRILDLCAAPGGKTALIAARGARVTAVERNANRIRRLNENLARLGLTAEIVHGDAAAAPETGNGDGFDGVLLDAPCSSTGTLRRHPDVAWLKRPEDVEKLAGAQDRLLRAAAERVRPGGLLVYCVCSLQRREGEDRVAAFLAADPRYRREPITAGELPGMAETVTADGDLRSLPCHLGAEGGIDGFYAARLRRL
ncbi:RsmB/NOP family class I SAM-dependent RNA methyltransferase [Oceanibacterium hippocampi]|uniref:Ribosomal RNA small subunit methyltransferase B n=1 Tax=Oceanibacterium hippocampi TaxID=745714 RepID=A0A1Y5REA5_9PROT|nr:transcription antitermination factor NusB [Oceanibacterium hippocampi]SLN15445.1 Ribosomal RNA small subunit methyltransferase B [Oceanibacterium hippocampi]